MLAGRIFVFGGERLNGTFNQAEAYDPATDMWATLTPVPLSRHGTGAATVGNYIFIPAGAPLNGGSAQTNGHQAFTLHTLPGSGDAENVEGGGQPHEDED